MVINMGINYFIHGTTSDTLKLLPHTSFTLMEPIEMLEKYGIVPTSGEIIQGGHCIPSHKCYPCFGRLKGKDCNSYTLDKMDKYLHPRPHRECQKCNKKYSIWSLRYFTQNTVCTCDKNNLREQIEIGSHCAYSNIKCIILYAARCIQKGINIDSIITPNLLNVIHSTYDALHCILVFGTILFPKRVHEPLVYDAVYTHLTLDNIMANMEYNNIEYGFFRRLYNNRDKISPDDKIRLEYDLFGLPTTSIVKTGITCLPMEVTLTPDESFPFSFDKNEIKDKKYESYNSDYLLYRYQENCHNYNIESILERYLKGECTDEFLQEFHGKLLKAMNESYEKLELLRNIYQLVKPCPIVDDLPDMPIILMVKDESCFKHLAYESRAEYKPLRLGIEITGIATDTKDNLEIIRQYINKYEIICLLYTFDELKYMASKL